MRVYQFDGAFTYEGETHGLRWYAAEVPSDADIRLAADPLVCIKLEYAEIDVDERGDNAIARLSLRVVPPTNDGAQLFEVAGAKVNPVEARMNELEHAQRLADRKLDQILAALTGKAAAPAPVATTALVTDETPIVSRPSRRTPTAEMNADQDPKSGSMGLVGAAPRSQILRPGIGNDGKPTLIEQPMTKVGDTLRR